MTGLKVGNHGPSQNGLDWIWVLAGAVHEPNARGLPTCQCGPYERWVLHESIWSELSHVCHIALPVAGHFQIFVRVLLLKASKSYLVWSGFEPPQKFWKTPYDNLLIFKLFFFCIGPLRNIVFYIMTPKAKSLRLAKRGEKKVSYPALVLFTRATQVAKSTRGSWRGRCLTTCYRWIGCPSKSALE